MKNENNTQHTPGPWTAAIDQDENMIEITSETNGVIVGKIPFISEDHPSFKKDEANAQLIASAPDILDALKALKKRLEFSRTKEQEKYSKDDTFWLNLANEAIAKAEGKALGVS